MAAGLKLFNLDPVTLTGGAASQLYSSVLSGVKNGLKTHLFAA